MEPETPQSLPPALREFAASHAGLIGKLRARLSELPDGLLDEGDLWDMLAAERSPAWIQAQAGLAMAQGALDLHMSDENRPLGGIGMALNGGEMDRLSDDHLLALATFTHVNGQLRTDRNMQTMIGHLQDIQVTIRHSEEVSRQALRAAQKLASLTDSFDPPATKAPRTVQHAAAERTVETRKPRGRLSAAFARYREKVAAARQAALPAQGVKAATPAP